jgi:hypothetical protein
MTGKLKQFFFRLLIFSICLGLIAWTLGLILPEGTLTPALPWLFALFFGVSIVVHWIVLRISELKPSRFVSYFMLATFGKLLIYIIAVLAYVFTRKEGLLPFIVAFFLLYIFYTVFEVSSILKQTKALHE